MATCSWVFCLFVCITQFNDIVSAVRIAPLYTEIEILDTFSEVTVPCVYVTHSKVSPQITWYIHGKNQDFLLMKVEINGSVDREKNFEDRADRGDSASLILKEPTSKDTGLYWCEVMIASDNPMLAKALVNLSVTETSVHNADLSTVPIVIATSVSFVSILGNFRCFMPRYYWEVRKISVAVMVCTCSLSFASIVCILLFVSELVTPDWLGLLGLVCGIIGIISGLAGFMCDVYRQITWWRIEESLFFTTSENLMSTQEVNEATTQHL